MLKEEMADEPKTTGGPRLNDSSPIRILVLAANPQDSDRLRLDREVREIEEGLQRSRHRDRFVLKSIWAPRHRDLRRALLDYEPTIVHFCGHNSRTDGLSFEGEDGSTHAVSGPALADLFLLFKDKVKCVVLNACYSEAQAEEIARHIGVVVGMSKAVADETALEFAVAFYDALASGKDYAFAFQLASAAIRVANLPGHLIPRLLLKQGEELPPPLPPPPRPGRRYAKSIGVAALSAMVLLLAVIGMQCFDSAEPWLVRVIQPDDRPMVDAEVVFYSEGGTFRATTDNLGAATLPAAARRKPGRLTVQTEAYASYEQQFEQPPVGHTEVRLRKRRPEDGEVLFRLVDTAGEPVPQATVHLFLGADAFSQMTGNDGLIKLPVGFEDGKADVRLSVQHSSCDTNYQLLTLRADTLQDVRLDCASNTLEVRPR